MGLEDFGTASVTVMVVLILPLDLEVFQGHDVQYPQRHHLNLNQREHPDQVMATAVTNSSGQSWSVSHGRDGVTNIDEPSHNPHHYLQITRQIFFRGQ